MSELLKPCWAAVSCLVLGGLCAGVEVEVTGIEGRVVRGVIQSWSEADGLEVRTASDVIEWPADAVMRVRPVGPASPSASPKNPANMVILTDGSKLAGRLLSYDGVTARLGTARFGDFAVSGDWIRAACWDIGARDSTGRSGRKLDELLAGERDAQDALVLLGKETVSVVRGALLTLGEGEGRFQYRDKPMPFLRDRLLGLVLAGPPRREEAGAVAAELADGTRVLGRISSGNDNGFVIEADFGRVARISWEDVDVLRVRSGRVVFLSDLEPTRRNFDPLLNIEWPMRRDRNVANGPLRMGGRSYAKGLGVHSQSQLTYAPPEGCRSFAAAVGIDDAARPRGNVVFRVLVDGREAWTSGPVTGRDEERRVVVPARGARELSLVVEYGDGLDVGDYADWAEARFIRE